jgi:hypothetical protein
MNDEAGFLGQVLRDLTASTAAILAAWGALGGATNALSTKMRLRDAIRHILLGGLIAAGMGSLSLALIARWLGLPSEAVPAGAASGSAAYLVGVFGPAVIEVTLARIRSLRAGPEAVPMRELLRLARLRCDSADPCRRFRHRLRIGLAVAALILSSSRSLR